MIRIKVYFAICLLTQIPIVAKADWKKMASTDALTREKIPYMSSMGHGVISQFGHRVTSELIIRCAHPADGSPAHLSVDLLFSERVSVGDLKGRILFVPPNHVYDDVTIGGFDNGRQFTILGGPEQELQESKKLRVQLSLPWAGDPVLEFDTTGAAEALNKMPCKW